MMKNKDCKILENLINEIERCKDKEEKSSLRNHLFVLMQKDIDSWIRSMLKKKGLFAAEEEILSLSWDCFEFSLNSYDPKKKIPPINHFFAYTKFYIMAANSKKIAEKNKFDFVKSEDFIDFEIAEEEDALNSLEELKKFRELLSDDLSVIFDDALMSMRAATKDRQRRLEKTPLNYSRYHNSKKIFKIVIDFLLRR